MPTNIAIRTGIITMYQIAIWSECCLENQVTIAINFALGLWEKLNVIVFDKYANVFVLKIFH